MSGALAFAQPAPQRRLEGAAASLARCWFASCADQMCTTDSIRKLSGETVAQHPSTVNQGLAPRARSSMQYGARSFGAGQEASLYSPARCTAIAGCFDTMVPDHLIDRGPRFSLEGECVVRRISCLSGRRLVYLPARIQINLEAVSRPLQPVIRAVGASPPLVAE